MSEKNWNETVTYEFKMHNCLKLHPTKCFVFVFVKSLQNEFSYLNQQQAKPGSKKAAFNANQLSK
jgi:hypothetical protein